jgi:hypothetical protein
MPPRLHAEFTQYMNSLHGARILSRASRRFLFRVLADFEQAVIAFSPGFSYIDLLQCLYTNDTYTVVPAAFTQEEYSTLLAIRDAYGVYQSDLLRLAMLSVLHPEGSAVLPLKSLASYFYCDPAPRRLSFRLYNEVIDLFNDTRIADLRIQKIPFFRASACYFSRVNPDIDKIVTADVSRFTLSSHSWVLPDTESCGSFYRLLKEKTGFTGAALFNLSLYHFLLDIKTGAVYGKT